MIQNSISRRAHLRLTTGFYERERGVVVVKLVGLATAPEEMGDDPLIWHSEVDQWVHRGFEKERYRGSLDNYCKYSSYLVTSNDLISSNSFFALPFLTCFLTGYINLFT